jgi:2-oxoisovalerate dehydrogenase E1 component alpha subunit
MMADVLRVLSEDGSLDPARDPRLSEDMALKIYELMVLARILDERLVALQRQGRIGFHIGSNGEEAAIIASAAALRDQDWIFPCYREFGAALWRGMKLEQYVHHMFGDAKDPVKGRQMPDHYSARAAKFASISSPIGTQITQGVGFAWAAKMKKDDLVTLVYFGEGATSSGEFHNGINFAGVYKTPSVLFCRNNGWAISVPAEKQTASETFAQKGIAYGVPGVRVDGNDMFAVYAATRAAVEKAARGEGPTLIEALTYRMSGHSTSDDPRAYRRDDTLESWRRRDPIQRARRYLDARGIWSDQKQAELVQKIEERLKETIAEAESTDPPALDSMFEDVYGDVPRHLCEQRDEVTRGPRPKIHH